MGEHKHEHPGAEGYATQVSRGVTHGCKSQETRVEKPCDMGGKLRR